MSAPRVLVSGRALPLDRMIGKGGEGVVYRIAGDPAHAVKLYTTSDRLNREDKVVAMVKHGLAGQSPLVAFPLAVAHLSDGTFAGFVMKLVMNHRPIHELYAPGSRKQHFPKADYRFLARAASNIARAFASVHKTGCVVGDINHSGVLVSMEAVAALIDADSFQFTADGEQYLCKVGVPEYTPPELQGKPLSGIVRTQDHDAFGLAVMLFQVLLMGRHPFVGTVRRGELPPMDESIRDFRYVYAEDRDVGMDQPPGTPALSDFSAELAALFNRAFSKSGVGRRPSAKEWVDALVRFEGSLVRCPDNAQHYGPKDASECAWCEMEQRFNTFLFPPHYGGTEGLAVGHPGAGNFDLTAVWARIARVQIPQLEQVLPPVTPGTPEASLRARAAKDAHEKFTGGVGLLLLGLALGILVLFPQAWILWGGLGILGFKRLGGKRAVPLDASSFHDEYVQAMKQWFYEQDSWRRRVGLSELQDLRGRLAEVKDRYVQVADEERRQVQEYRQQRRERQLHFYLEGFDIARANVNGVGHARLAALASYGIDTAADVTSARLAAVPGFGEALVGRLLQWRRRLEARFVYNAAENDADRQEMQRIRSAAETRSSSLRSTLAAGVQELEARAARLHDVIRKPDPVLEKVSARVAQARVDLEFLGQNFPTVTPPAPPRPRPTPAPQATRPPPALPPRPAATGATPSCPRCGSAMRQRRATRGRNAGSYFWGCSRFPNCKGTRNI